MCIRDSLYFDACDWVFTGFMLDYVNKERKFDIFNVEWEINDAGKMPKPDRKLLEDVTKWREFVNFPDTSKIDWEQMAAEMCIRDRYIDTADKKTFLYTKSDVYETDLKLYELEEQLEDADFFRANKSCIINFRHIASLKSELNRRLLVTMTNGEKLIVSRQYAEYKKEKLGVR